MDEHLLRLLNYDGVLMALVTTNDGLVVGTAGLGGDDSEVVAAAGTSLASSGSQEPGAGISVPVEGGVLHLLRGDEVSLIAVTESEITFEAIRDPMDETLERVLAEIG